MNRLTQQMFLAVLGTTTLAAHAQHVPEHFPREGELRFNNAIYKASHNSYERSEPLYEQVDEHNVWMIELDLFYDEGQSDGMISVEHFCLSAHNAQSLNWELDELNQSLIKDVRPTVIILDMKGGDGPCYQDWPSAEVYRPIIYQSFIDTLGEGLGEQYFYTAGEFKDESGDNERWPSAQELVRRGKRWIVILSDDDSSRPDSDFFFGITFSNPPTDSGRENRVLVNIDGGCDIDPTDESPQTIDDKWMYRAYPGGFCDICSEQNGGYWDNAVSRGYTFVATNCINDNHTWDERVHSPMPMYVGNGVVDTQRGTIYEPFVGPNAVLAASSVASPGVPVMVRGISVPLFLVPTNGSGVREIVKDPAFPVVEIVAP